ncbi:2-(R)-hydroxypropyl-CoM dehydrogenase [Clostridium liquoris]|jgi:NAD(P)-dependent dehydrogenase (short-subunit alcohol dehydrogenase family)|uniref:2-(R)-hydroxypropyl-CoM dehydrogenase n=1 Tax=Clostridium liquoris TaxID=1289519 RepID=A0A2T0B7V0_9CLOT|nr:SDR family oxidoreductase [Clostridium liquoris]PRR79903.1 2-(R)-hydroxypropyl-CoM dehydrogenase [Clostridium liquoris]
MNALPIAGENEGIGYFIAKQWLENGNYVSVLDLNYDNIDELKKAYSKTLLTFKCDACDLETVKMAVNNTSAQFGSINYAVHNACLCLFKGFEEHTIEDFDRVIDVNFHGAINLTKAVLPIMKTQR